MGYLCLGIPPVPSNPFSHRSCMVKGAASLLVLSVAAVLCGCATIMRAKTEEVTFDSSPSGVEIYKDGTKFGITPFTTTLPHPKPVLDEKKKEIKPILITAKKEGHEDLSMPLQVGTHPWAWVDITFLTGLLGTTSLIVDDGNGAAYEYDPNSYFITLTPQKASQVERGRLAKKTRLRNFVLSSYSSLQSDLARGGGEYLESLNALLVLTAGRAGAEVAELRQLSAQHPTVPAFAEAVVEYFFENGTLSKES